MTVEAHEGLARRLAWRFTGGLDDDALQAARVGIWLALRRWDPRRGRFSTCAGWWVRHALARWRGSRELVRVPEHARGLASPRRYEAVPQEVAGWGDPVEGAAAAEEASLLRARVARLPARERAAVEARLAGRDQRAIAAALGLSRARVCQLLARATERLRRMRP